MYIKRSVLRPVLDGDSTGVKDCIEEARGSCPLHGDDCCSDGLLYGPGCEYGVKWIVSLLERGGNGGGPSPRLDGEGELSVLR